MEGKRFKRCGGYLLLCVNSCERPLPLYFFTISLHRSKEQQANNTIRSAKQGANMLVILSRDGEIVKGC